MLWNALPERKTVRLVCTARGVYMYVCVCVCVYVRSRFRGTFLLGPCTHYVSQALFNKMDAFSKAHCFQQTGLLGRGAYLVQVFGMCLSVSLDSWLGLFSPDWGRGGRKMDLSRVRVVGPMTGGSEQAVRNMKGMK
ncbi:hypothetical protein LX32DRAFT_407439 [Colletotrichum zoysiae]|uniref:Uncharacterized protein n=1 Tax=Colletotrichum zoysiae TaxID=1216348 RepID=A0AAD9HH20_9PEZI|nr:hypothetical protein LX32DRAFT_407439 [Colletotrichum zoysiae]